MAYSPTAKGATPLAGLVGAAALGSCCLLMVALFVGNLAPAAHRVTSRPLILQAGRLFLSAEITARPYCAPLLPSIVCLVHQTDRRPDYLSVWVYFTTPPGAEWSLSGRPLLTIWLGPNDPLASPEHRGE